DATEPAEGFMVVFGANINFIDGQFANIRDAGAIEDSIIEAAKKAGLPMPRYIRPKGGAEFTRD
ncbi:MAG: 2,4'-dihydroxyacetophenone dioxygenase, partial [Achromobacter piechaudii]